MNHTLVSQTTVTPAEDSARRRRFPRGADVTLDDLTDAGREPVLDTLRDTEPVSWVPALGGWLVTSWAAARDVLSPRSDATVEAHENLVRASLGPTMLTTDGVDHRRLRRPFESPFKPNTVQRSFADLISASAVELLGPIVRLGRAELCGDFAEPFAVRMAGLMLGLSLGQTGEIARMYAAFAEAMVYDGRSEPLARADAARAELNAILYAELEQSRRQGTFSITGQVATKPGTLTDDEIVAQLRVLLFGAVETIQASVMNTLLQLLQHPESHAEVGADPGLLDNAADEAIRLIPPVAFMERWTRSPLSIAGVDIPQNEFIGISVLAANRDPATFRDPFTYDIHRDNSNRALSFSFGPHACLGLHLARIETTIAVQHILDRLPDLQIVDFDPPAGFAFRRPSRLVVRWSP